MLAIKKTNIAWLLGRLVWVAVICMAFVGCASISSKKTSNPSPGSHAWGSQSTLFPSWHRISRAASKAVRDPQTWAPAMGAILFSATDWDKDVSRWAQRNTPVSESQKAALKASDDLWDGTKYGAVITALLTPNGQGGVAAVNGKAKGMSLQLGTYFATESATTIFKRGAARRRPNGVNNHSFPSGHTSSAFAAGTLARRNISVSGYSPTTSYVLDAGFISFGAGTSWARVEAGMHYPSDVLAGAALGHFIAAVVNDAFIGERPVGKRSIGKGSIKKHSADKELPRISIKTSRNLVKISFLYPLY